MENIDYSENTGNPMIHINVKNTAIFLCLTAIGLAGNYFKYQLFFSIDFLFGSIFALLVMQMLGTGPGVVSAFLVSTITYVLWNHPYAIIIMTTEALIVALLTTRRRFSLVMADVIYWCVIGIPLVFLFYFEVMDLAFTTAAITMLKQAVNGITNALLARFIFMTLSYLFSQVKFSMREVLFNCLFMFVLLPSLLFLSVESRKDQEEIDRRLRESLLLTSQRTTANLDAWLHDHLKRMKYLAFLAGTNSVSYMQTAIEQMKASDEDFLRIGLLDSNATIVAHSPLVDELGQRNLGKNFADRPYIPVLKSNLKPILSEVVMGRIGIPKPFVTLLAPVISNGAYGGYMSGILNLSKAEEILSLNAMSQTLPKLKFTLMDNKNKIIITNREDSKIMEIFTRKSGELTQLDNNVFQWLPIVSKNISISDKWKSAVYVAESPLGDFSEWKLILEAPIEPFQIAVYSEYSQKLLQLFIVLLITAILGDILSKNIIRSLEKLNTITYDLPKIIASRQEIKWHESTIKEITQLIDHFKIMWATLKDKFQELQDMNESLENRIQERTENLRISEEKYRVIFNNEIYAICIFDLKTLKFHDVNQAYVNLYGYTKEELLSEMTIHDITAEHENSDKATQLAIDKGTIFIPLRFHRKKDGTVFPVEIVGGPYNWNNRNVMFALAHDISDRKSAEDRLREALQEKEILLREIHHRVKNNLQVVMSLLNMQSSSSSDPRFK
ncbi:MAG: PAS domain S-box protein, partial [Deltaproteobacteria bacterium]|nr:PAS domain S-box protein [Deltaproteobacteria bacterium]